jgi:hypothetical protein
MKITDEWKSHQHPTVVFHCLSSETSGLEPRALNEAPLKCHAPRPMGLGPASLCRGN